MIKRVSIIGPKCSTRLTKGCFFGSRARLHTKFYSRISVLKKKLSSTDDGYKTKGFVKVSHKFLPQMRSVILFIVHLTIKAITVT